MFPLCQCFEIQKGRREWGETIFAKASFTQGWDIRMFFIQCCNIVPFSPISFIWGLPQTMKAPEGNRGIVSEDKWAQDLLCSYNGHRFPEVSVPSKTYSFQCQSSLEGMHILRSLWSHRQDLDKSWFSVNKGNEIISTKHKRSNLIILNV